MAEASSSQEASFGVLKNGAPPSWTFDVFLSFRGEDTRFSLIDFLYDGLVERGFSTFIDDNKIRRGEEIGLGLLKAIEESRVSIVVLSENYASSRWCLDELVKIMECRSTLGQIVLPVFYNVVPSHVRWQTGVYTEAFTRHQERFGDDQVRRWRAALTKVADLSGFVIPDTDGIKSKFIQYIIKEVARILDPAALYVSDYPVGIESHAKKLRELLNLGSDDVRIIAIWGMGGIGKTTIAKATYNLILTKFDCTCFLPNVSETWNQYNGLVKLQNMFLSQILLGKMESITNSDHGIEVIKQRAWCQRVLLVLDDVDDVEQLRTLVINRDLLRSGSRIIITTRNLSLISSLQLQESEVYKPEVLNKEESLKLFSWHAFKKDCPLQDYEMLSAEMVDYAGGLPLALKVLGSFFMGRSIPEWISGLEKLKTSSHNNIGETLRVSFDSLDDYAQKDLFLDIACFFVGMNKDLAIKILEGCGFFPECDIKVLVHRALLQIDSDNRLMMHGQIQDMGREIVR